MGIPPYISTLRLALLCEGVDISELLHAMAMSHKGGIAEITLRLLEVRGPISMSNGTFEGLTPLGALETLQSLCYQFGKDTALQLSYHDLLNSSDYGPSAGQL